MKNFAIAISSYLLSNNVVGDRAGLHRLFTFHIQRTLYEWLFIGVTERSAYWSDVNPVGTTHTRPPIITTVPPTSVILRTQDEMTSQPAICTYMAASNFVPVNSIANWPNVEIDAKGRGMLNAEIAVYTNIAQYLNGRTHNEIIADVNRANFNPLLINTSGYALWNYDILWTRLYRQLARILYLEVDSNLDATLGPSINNQPPVPEWPANSTRPMIKSGDRPVYAVTNHEILDRCELLQEVVDNIQRPDGDPSRWLINYVNEMIQATLYSLIGEMVLRRSQSGPYLDAFRADLQLMTNVFFNEYLRIPTGKQTYNWNIEED